MRTVSYIQAVSCMPEYNSEKHDMEHQKALIVDVGEKNQLNIRRWYREKSDDINAETAFRKLREDGMQRQFDRVVIASVFQCGKTVSDAADVLEKIFFPAGINFVVAEDEFFSKGKTGEEVHSYFCDKIRMQNAAHMKAEEDKTLASGIFPVHEERYGYLLNDDQKSFCIDEEAAVVIREVFSLAAQGNSMKTIAGIMNERGVESPGIHLNRVSKKKYAFDKERWSGGTVSHMLKNKSFTGEWTRRAGSVTVQITAPPIIEKVVFEQVQQMIADKTPYVANRFHPEANIFAQRIFDAKTGAPVHCRKCTGCSKRKVFELSRENHSILRIPFEKVLCQVKKALKTEFAQADRVEACMDTEAAEKIRITFREKYTERMTKLCLMIAEKKKEQIELAQNDETDKKDYDALKNEIGKLDRELEELAVEEAQTELSFSRKNRWIACFAGNTVPKELTQKRVRTWIEKIEIDESQITVIMKWQEEKSRIPEWCFRKKAGGKTWRK